MNETHYDEGLLRAYLDGEIAGPEQQAITTHLEGCERCRGQIEELRALASGASPLLATYEPTPNLQAALDRQRQLQRAAVRAPKEEQRGLTRWPRRQVLTPRAASAGMRAPARPALVGMGLAVVMVLVLAALVLYEGANRTAGPGKPPAIEWAKFPPELGASVLMGRQDGYGRVRIYPVDPETGESIANYEPIVVGKSSWPRAFSEDGATLAVIEGKGMSCEPWAGGSTCRASTDVLHLIDLQTWSQVTTSLSLKGSVLPLTFSPDGTRLAMGYHEYAADYTRSDNVGVARNSIILIDVTTAKVIAEKELPFGPGLSAIGFSQDGATIAVYGQPNGSPPGTGQPGPPQLLLFDASSLELKWDQVLEDVASGSWCETNCEGPHEDQVGAVWAPAMVLSHDRQKLYIAHADEDKLTTVDLKEHTVRSTEVRVARSWFEELLALTADVAQAKRLNNGVIKSAVLSPDGTRLYVSGLSYMAAENEQKQGSLGLEVIDVETGRIVARQETEAMQIKGSPDGHHLYLDYWGQSDGWIEVLDAGTLQSVVRMHEWSPAAIRRLNGEQLVVASRSQDQERQEFAVLDPNTYEVMHSWKIHGIAEWVAGP